MYNSKDFPTIKQSTIDTLNDYAQKGWLPGSFCEAVLENNLMESFGRADMGNRDALFEICSYVYNELPSSCHGSPEKVKEWIEKFKEKNKNEL